MKISQLFESTIDVDAQFQPFYKNFEGVSFYHGTNGWEKEGHIGQFKFRERPTDTLRLLHNDLNQKAIEKFGIPIRNLLFTYLNHREDFGMKYKVIPIGENYRVFAVPGIIDFTAYYDAEAYRIENKLKNAMEIDDISKDQLNSVIDYVVTNMYSNKYKTLLEFQKDVNSYIEKNINDATIKEMLIYNIAIVIKSYMHKADSYMKKCVEIKSKNDINETLKNSEFMIYAPDNFYALYNG